jgi:hypothetical protein
MSNLGALAKLQRSGAEFYLKIAEKFRENSLIREAWITLAQDLEQQIESLRELPASFWRGHEVEVQVLQVAIAQCPPPKTGNGAEPASLHACFTHTLDFEEPLILRAYVPLIKALRADCTNQALDFYIKVKAHVARLNRIIQPFSGDPVLTQRTINLLQVFEREVQGPPPLPARKPVAAAAKSARRARHPHKTAHLRSGKGAQPLGRTKGIAKHSKPLVRKIKLPRRRARR